MINISFLQNGQLRSVRKGQVIKNVAYITQEIDGELFTFQLSPPRNMKITNKAGSYYKKPAQKSGEE